MFETQVAMKKAMEAIVVESKNECDDVLVCRTDGYGQKVVGYECKKTTLKPGERIDQATADALLKRDVEHIETEMRLLFFKRWDSYGAPEIAALLELGHYMPPRELDRIMGLRQSIASGLTVRIAEILRMAPEMRRRNRFGPHMKRIDRICKQLETGRFIDVERKKKVQVEVVKATVAEEKEVTHVAAESLAKPSKQAVKKGKK